MIIFLYGPDTYRSRQKLNEIIEHYKKIHKSGLNLRYFDCQKISFQDFKDELQQVGMFKEKKLAVLTNSFLNSEFKEQFFKNAKSFKDSEDIILIYETKPIPHNDSLFKFLIQNKRHPSTTQSQEFKLLEGLKLKNWVKKEFNRYQTEIDSKTLGRLVDFVGNNLWQMSNEIKKLVNYKNRQKIEVADIELLVKPKIESDIFKTIDSISQKNKEQALKLLKGHLEKGDNPLYLLTMINFQFRNLLTIKNLSQKSQSPYLISKITNLHPYLVKKSYSQAQKFTLEELKKIYRRLFQIDLSIKTGKIDSETALDLFIAEVC